MAAVVLVDELTVRSALSLHAAEVVTPPLHCVPLEHYANAVRAEPNRCWRMASRPPGPQVGSPADCEEPVRRVGRAVVGRRRMRMWSCDGHVEGLDDLRRLGPRQGGREVPSRRYFGLDAFTKVSTGCNAAVTSLC